MKRRLTKQADIYRYYVVGLRQTEISVKSKDCLCIFNFECVGVFSLIQSRWGHLKGMLNKYFFVFLRGTAGWGPQITTEQENRNDVERLSNYCTLRFASKTISLKNYLREFDKRSMKVFSLGNHFINSHNLSFWCVDIVRRKLMLVTLVLESLSPFSFLFSTEDGVVPNHTHTILYFHTHHFAISARK